MLLFTILLVILYMLSTQLHCTFLSFFRLLKEKKLHRFGVCRHQNKSLHQMSTCHFYKNARELLYGFQAISKSHVYDVISMGY